MPVFEHSMGSSHRFAVEGNGPLVVLIHGVGARLENWDGVAGRLAAQFQRAALRLARPRRKQAAPGPYSLSCCADDLKALLDHSAADDAHVAGHSLGGMIAQMSRCGIRGASQARAAQRRRRPHRGGAGTVTARIELIRSGDRRRPFPQFAVALVLRRFHRGKSRADRRLCGAQRGERSRQLCGGLSVLALEDLDRELEAIKAPTLVATGEHDLGSNPRMSELMIQRITGATLRDPSTASGTRSWSRRRTWSRACWSRSSRATRCPRSPQRWRRERRGIRHGRQEANHRRRVPQPRTQALALAGRARRRLRVPDRRRAAPSAISP